MSQPVPVPLRYRVTHRYEKVTMSSSEEQRLLDIVSWKSIPNLAHGRTAYEALQIPANCPGFEKDTLSGVKMKGVGTSQSLMVDYSATRVQSFWSPGDEPNEVSNVLVPPSAVPYTGFDGFPHLGIGTDKYFIASSKPSPQGGMLHSRAVLEYESARTLVEAGVPSIVPFAVVEYEDIIYNGEPLGAVICLQREPKMQRIGSIQFQHCIYGACKSADNLYDEVRSAFGVSGDAQTESTRLATVSGLARHVGGLMRQFSAAGLYRYAPEWTNFEYDSRTHELFLTDLDSSLPLSSLQPEERILEIGRDLVSSLYRCIGKLAYPTALRSYSINGIRRFDPLKHLLGGYFPTAPDAVVQAISEKLLSVFIPHFALLQRHADHICGSWTWDRRVSYKMDHEIFWLCAMREIWPLLADSALFEAHPNSMTQEKLDRMAKEFLVDRADYYDYLVGGSFS